jgi:ubiquinone/menaquinone biosynthesis C-methylase UbiE
VVDLESLVNKLKAAGETTRLRLLALLAQGDLSVKDLTEILGQSQPRVSRHLKLLADADLVVRHAEGAWAYYGLSSEVPDLAHWLIGQLAVAQPDPVRQRDAARLEQVRRVQEQQAASYFAKVAQSWDLLRSLHVAEAAVETEIEAVASAGRIDFLLDLGTGTGRMLELLGRHYRRGLGIDSSREMLTVARSKLAAADIGHAQVRLGDITTVDDSVGPADLIVIHQVLHYFDDPGRIILQARRALRLGGRMLVVDFAPHMLEFLRTGHAHRRLGLSDAQMTAWARTAGLGVAAVKTFPSNSADGLTVCVWTLAERGAKDIVP